jgi:hypothetical protein
MADGSTKRADRIWTGDRLICYGGQVLTVSEVITGEEVNLCQINTENGLSIKVTFDHVLLQKDKTGIAAKHLSPGKVVMLRDDTLATITSVETIPYNDTVYSFMLKGEEGHYLIADGFCSGDFYIQNMLRSRDIESMREKLAYMEKMEKALKDRLKFPT